MNQQHGVTNPSALQMQDADKTAPAPHKPTSRYAAVEHKNLQGVLSALESAYLSIHQDRCIQVRNRNARCFKCVDACTSGCIAIVDNSVVVDVQKCIGCGSCSSACPTHALEAINPTDDELITHVMRTKDVQEVHLACYQVTSAIQAACELDSDCAVLGADAAAVICAGRIEEALLMRLAASGVEKVSVWTGPCESCPHSAGGLLCEERVNELNTLLSDMGSQTTVEMIHLNHLSPVPCPPHQTAPVRIQPVGRTPFVKVMDDGTLPHYIPDRREKFLDACYEIMQDSQVYNQLATSDKRAKTRLCGHVLIDIDSCVSCTMCATFCPTGAIRKGPLRTISQDQEKSHNNQADFLSEMTPEQQQVLDEELIADNERQGLMTPLQKAWKRASQGETSSFAPTLIHTPSDCVQCRCCADICPGNAITVLSEMPYRKIFTYEEQVIELNAQVNPPNNPHQIAQAMGSFEGMTNVYER